MDRGGRTGPDGADRGGLGGLRPLGVPGPARIPRPRRSRQPERVRTGVDRFLQAALAAEGLAPGPDADRDTLIRRVSLDLTGLPPTPREILAFRADASPDAYERMVDRYLASPHYGERWGKHWLDAAGYADSNGYFSADTDRPLAYRYRDYVVRSFNADKPLDRLVREQLAGDEISGYRPDQAASPEMIDLIEATHYLRNGQDGTDDSVPDNPEAQQIDRYAALEAIVQITANSMLGLTIQCARCHDHKFEPITQEEYYQLQSIFYPAFNPKDWIKPKDRYVFAYLPGEKEEWDARTKRIDAEVAVAPPGVPPVGREGTPPGPRPVRRPFRTVRRPPVLALERHGARGRRAGRPDRGRFRERARRDPQGGHPPGRRGAGRRGLGLDHGRRSTGRPTARGTGSR